ncbi:MAG: heat-shock protein Hsp20 [Bacteroidetes bacterium HGW-Bacteroidetes-21]|jgi:HSP20 family protein|nr:MAG: heat-shock protein Hsp20 [Bacteroidetes bacterium HGW-Bacteroidetes-21]
MLPTLRTNFPTFIGDIFNDDFMNEFIKEPARRNFVPAVNIAETKDDFRIEVAAPGIQKDDFKIDIENNVLTISSEKKQEQEEKSDKFLRREFSYASFKRSFALPQMVETEKISASHKDGILHVVIPKREEAKEKGPKSIAIE